MPHSLAILTLPDVEPVTVSEANTFADEPGNDALIGSLVKAAREFVEDYTGLALITQTWRMTLDNWPYSGCDVWFDGVREMPATQLETETIKIPKVPFVAITSVSTLDEDSVATAWASTNYYAVKEFGDGRLVRKAGVPWPVLTRNYGGIQIDFTCGYGDTPADVPEDLRLAIRVLVKHWYDHPDMMACEGSSGQMPMHVKAMLDKRRVRRL